MKRREAAVSICLRGATQRTKSIPSNNNNKQVLWELLSTIELVVRVEVMLKVKPKI